MRTCRILLDAALPSMYVNPGGGSHQQGAQRVYNEVCAFVRTESLPAPPTPKNPASEHLQPHGKHLSLPRTAL
jgi:DNA-binding helix-hairpin-helix protein with protein kinase domain